MASWHSCERSTELHRSASHAFTHTRALDLSTCIGAAADIVGAWPRVLISRTDAGLESRRNGQARAPLPASSPVIPICETCRAQGRILTKGDSQSANAVTQMLCRQSIGPNRINTPVRLSTE